MAMQIVHYSDCGPVRPANQDAYCVFSADTAQGPVSMLAVCDGMGGLSSGEVASATVIRAFADWFRLELPLLLRRAKKHQPVFIPAEALHVSATCTWAGDVAELMARLLFQKQALGECYSLCTAEHHTWGEIAQMYEKLLDVQFVPVPAQDYLSFFENSLSARVQLRYDRLMQREMDNRKVLLAAGMQQADFTPLAEGLSRVLAALPESPGFPEAFQLWHVDAAMDAYAAAHPALI